jgi:hypothetical protein
LPALHATHVDWPWFGCTQPFGQFAHASSPSSRVPAPHTLHDVWPVLGWTHPPGHAVHAVCTVPAVEYAPSPHTPQDAWPALGCDHPAGQTVQEVTVPVVENVPMMHVLFVVAPPDAGHVEPPGHAVHVALVAVPAAS